MNAQRCWVNALISRVRFIENINIEFANYDTKTDRGFGTAINRATRRTQTARVTMRSMTLQTPLHMSQEVGGRQIEGVYESAVMVGVVEAGLCLNDWAYSRILMQTK